MRTKAKPKADAIYISVGFSASLPDGTAMTYPRGERRRGDDFGVQTWPQHWVGDGLPLPSRVAGVELPGPDEDITIVEAPRITFRARQRMTFGSGHTLRVIEEGQELDDNDWAVKAQVDGFDKIVTPAAGER